MEDHLEAEEEGLQKHGRAVALKALRKGQAAHVVAERLEAEGHGLWQAEELEILLRQDKAAAAAPAADCWQSVWVGGWVGVRACVRACVSACVRACLCVCGLILVCMRPHRCVHVSQTVCGGAGAVGGRCTPSSPQARRAYLRIRLRGSLCGPRQTISVFRSAKVCVY